MNEDWEAAGPLRLDLDLGMVPGQAPDHLAVATTLEGVALALGRSRLTLEDLRGTVTYAHPGALSAQSLTGTLFDGPLRAAITGSLEDGGLAFASEGDLRGKLTRWLRIPYLDGLAGAMSYTSDLRIERSGALELSARSEAVDLRTGLPAPLDARDSVLDLRYQQTETSAKPHRRSCSWPGGRVAARASFEAGAPALRRPRSDAPLPPELPAYGVTVQGRVSRFELDPWLARVATFPTAEGEEGAGAPPWLRPRAWRKRFGGMRPLGGGPAKLAAGQVSAPYFVFSFPAPRIPWRCSGRLGAWICLCLSCSPLAGSPRREAAPQLLEAAGDHGRDHPAPEEDPFSWRPSEIWNRQAGLRAASRWIGLSFWRGLRGGHL